MHCGLSVGGGASKITHLIGDIFRTEHKAPQIGGIVDCRRAY